MEVILRSGQVISLKDYQKVNKLDSTKLSDNFSVSEFDCNGELVIAEPLIHFLELFRATIKRPVKINSGYRTKDYQEDLKKTNKGAATNSPHTVGMAADIDTYTRKESEEFAKIILDLASKHSYDVRVGWKQYSRLGSTFVHIDICPMYYGEGKPYAKDKVADAWRIKNLVW